MLRLGRAAGGGSPASCRRGAAGPMLVPLGGPAGGAWMTEQAADGAAKHSSRTRMAARIVLALVLIVVIFWYLLKDISLADVWAAITAMTWIELAGLAVVAGWNLLTYAFVWMTVTPGLTFGRAMVMTQATTAITNTVPAGSAVGIGMTYAMLGSWGFSRSRTTIAVLVSGVWNAF